MNNKFQTTSSKKAIKELLREYGKINLILFIIGLIFLIFGYIMMNFVNPTASNFLGYFAPIVIIISIVIIFISLIVELDK